MGDADRYNHRDGNDDYGQPRALWNLFDEGQKGRLYDNYAAAMDGVPDEIIERPAGPFPPDRPGLCAGHAGRPGGAFGRRRKDTISAEENTKADAAE